MFLMGRLRWPWAGLAAFHHYCWISTTCGQAPNGTFSGQELRLLVGLLSFILARGRRLLFLLQFLLLLLVSLSELLRLLLVLLLDVLSPCVIRILLCQPLVILLLLLGQPLPILLLLLN
jgi:hypothetical protein